MGKRNDFGWKGKSNASAAPASKKKFTAPMLGLEDIYFTWGTVRDAARYAEVGDKLKKYVAVHFRDQAKVDAKAMEELNAPAFVKLVRLVIMYWTDQG